MPELWETEIEYWESRGMSFNDARTTVIIRWARQGDLRPLAAAIEAGPLDPPVLNLLSWLIREDRLRVVPAKRGSPRKPEAFPRNILAARAYEALDGPSEKRFEVIAEAIGMGDKTVRRAVSWWRKNKKSAI